MNKKHTPGPWKVIEASRMSHDGGHVADMSNGLMVVPVMRGLGNPLSDARLISAAPDLLEALQHLLVAHGEQLDYAFQQAQEAIAKATGEKL